MVAAEYPIPGATAMTTLAHDGHPLVTIFYSNIRNSQPTCETVELGLLFEYLRHVLDGVCPCREHLPHDYAERPDIGFEGDAQVVSPAGVSSSVIFISPRNVGPP